MPRAAPRMNSIYSRTDITMDIQGSPFWQAKIARIFLEYAQVDTVEVVHSGRLSDAHHRYRGATHAHPGCYVIMASTKGKWGKSRQDFEPIGPVYVIKERSLVARG